MARGIAQMSLVDTSRIGSVIALRDKFLANTPDHEWIGTLALERNWTIVSQDKFIKNDLEKEAIRKSGLCLFMLSKQWSSHQYWDKCTNLVKWWPYILDQAHRIEGGAAFRVKWHMNKKFEQVKM